MTGPEPASTDALARAVGARLEGPPRPATHLASPHGAAPGALVVALDAAAATDLLARPGADAWAAVLVPDAFEAEAPVAPLLRHPDPRLALARLSARFAPAPTERPGDRAGASVAEDAELAPDVAVGPGAVVASGARIGTGSVVGAGAVVGHDCLLGEDVRLHPGVVLYPRVRLGDRTVVHAGAVLGADGFGYVAGDHGAEKIHHLGGVRVDADVEIGANTCVDRGALDDTVIGAGTKIDNLCQIGHNVRLGRACLLAGNTAVGGSSVLEDFVQVGGGVAVADHVTVGAGARLSGRAGVTKDVPAGEAWGGFPAQPMRAWARERYLLSRLERIWAFVRRGAR